MRALYPLYRGPFATVGEFALLLRSRLLPLLCGHRVHLPRVPAVRPDARDRDALPGTQGIPGPLVFGYYAILVSMLSYTAGHLGKPIPAVFGHAGMGHSHQYRRVADAQHLARCRGALDAQRIPRCCNHLGRRAPLRLRRALVSSGARWADRLYRGWCVHRGSASAQTSHLAVNRTARPA